MEQGLTYIGATAIEDKLQERVPEVIAKIIENKTLGSNWRQVRDCY
jgi:magnesium-transporting ATPase (P-type)